MLAVTQTSTPLAPRAYRVRVLPLDCDEQIDVLVAAEGLQGAPVAHVRITRRDGTQETIPVTMEPVARA